MMNRYIAELEITAKMAMAGRRTPTGSYDHIIVKNYTKVNSEFQRKRIIS